MPAYFLTLRQVIFSAFLLSVLVVHVPAYAVDDCGSLTSFPVCDFADIHCQPCNGRCISEQSICILEPLPGGIDEITASQTGNLGAFYRYLNGGVWRWAFGVGIGAAVFAGVWKWRVPTNWKFGAENFLGDHYHGISHRSVELVDISPGMSKTDRSGNTFANRARGLRGNVSFPRVGHGSGGGPPFLGGNSGFPDFPENPAVDAYFQRVKAEREQRIGDQLKAPAATGTIFPNVSFHGWFPRGLAVWHPQGPTESEIWRIYLVDKDAPAEVKDLLRHYYLRYGGPVGQTETDDMENWNYATKASDGTIAKRYDYNYQMGMSHEEPVPALNEAFFTEGTSEQNPRAYYLHWARLMDGESWDQIMDGPLP